MTPETSSAAKEFCHAIALACEESKKKKAVESAEKRRMAIGDQCEWRYSPRGGYGYFFRTPAVVRKFGARRVQIEVKKSSGEKVFRWVTPDNLLPLSK